MDVHIYGLRPFSPRVNLENASRFRALYSANTGNLLFVFALYEMLDCRPDAIAWRGKLDHLDARSSLLLMPLANHIGAHVDMGRTCRSMCPSDVPIIGVGLGAQLALDGAGVKQVPPGTWAFLDHLRSRAPVPGLPNISVRGEETRALLEEKGYGDCCVVTGCQSNFLSRDVNLGRRVRERLDATPFGDGLRIAVTAGNPQWRTWRRLEQSLVRMVDQSRGLYVVQGPLSMLCLTTMQMVEMDSATRAHCNAYCAPWLDEEGFADWLRRFAHVFTDVPEWVRQLSHYDAVVGTRIHGCVAGIQAGVPSLCLYTDSRTRELCETMQIPHADARGYANGITPTDVGRLLREWDFDAYDARRQELAGRLSGFLESNGVPESAHLRGIAQS